MKFIKQLMHHLLHKKHEIWSLDSMSEGEQYYYSHHKVTCNKCSHARDARVPHIRATHPVDIRLGVGYLSIENAEIAGKKVNQYSWD